MSWDTAALDLRTPDCPAARRLSSGVRLRCVSSRTDGNPFGHVEGGCPTGWQMVARTNTGAFIRLRGILCSTCPVARLPSEMRRLHTVVEAGRVSVDVAYPVPSLLRDFLEALDQAGQTPRIVRRGPGERPASPLLVLDADGVTQLQWDVLHAAVEMGHFDHPRRAYLLEVSSAVGRSRATTHEHIRKGLDHLMQGVFPPGEEGEDRGGGAHQGGRGARWRTGGQGSHAR